MRDLYLLPYCFANTVTEHQNSVHGCFLLWLLNLGFWDGNWCFTDELSKRLVPRPTKDYLHNLTCIEAFSQTLQVCPTNACRDYKWFDVNAALRYPCYPFEYISLQAKTFFSTHSPRRYKPLKHPVDHPKRKKIFRLSIQTGCYLETHQSYSNNLHAPHTTQNGQVIYHS